MKRFVSLLMAFVCLFNFSSTALSEVLKLPKSLKTISEQAFSGDTSLSVVDLPYGAETIDSQAFANSSTSQIYIPGTVFDIADDAFDGTDVLISSPASSYAQTYAQEHGYDWEDSRDHYRMDGFLANIDMLNDGFQIEDPEIEDLERMSTAGVTDPEELAFINEYNAIVDEVQPLIDDHNAHIAEGEAVFSALADSISEFSFLSETTAGVGVQLKGDAFVFACGAMRFQVSGSIPEGAQVTDAALSENDNIVVLSLGSKKLYLSISENTIYLSDSPVRSKTSAAAVSKISQAEADRCFNILKDRFEKEIKPAYDAVEKWYKDQLEKADWAIMIKERVVRFHKRYLPHGHSTEADLAKAVKELNLAKAKAIAWRSLPLVSVGAEIANIVQDFISFQEIKEIYEHDHPTENDSSPGAEKAAKELNLTIEALMWLYDLDVMISSMNIVSTIAVVVNAVRVIAAPPPPIKAICAVLAAKSLMEERITKVCGIGLFFILGNIKGNVEELDEGFHTTVYGCVYDASTKLMLDDVTIALSDRYSFILIDQTYELYLLPGKYTLWFSKEGYATKAVEITLKAGERLEKNIEMATETPVSCFTYQIRNNEAIITGYTGEYMDVVVPETIENCPVTKIDTMAFSYCEILRSIRLPGTLTSIGSSAFSECTSLKSINIPQGVTTIGSSAFDGCTNLAAVSLPSTLTSIGGQAFAYCQSLKSINIPEGVTTIGFQAFKECTNLAAVSLPSTLISIGAWAFNYCSSLTNVAIPEGITTIEEGVFFCCNKLESVKLPNSLTSIEGNAFYRCDALTSIRIPGSVTYIGNVALLSKSLNTIYAGSTALANYLQANLARIVGQDQKPQIILY